MVQVPATFDPAKACIVTGTSSGSRGVYGAIGSSGEWGLKRGCVVAYADKGTGMGVHNLQDDTVNLIDGTRTTADLAGDASNFTAKLVAQQRQDFNANTPNRIAVKHAHSEQNPEKDWGRDTLRAVEFALYVLNEQYGETLPSGKKSRVITPENTIVIASSRVQRRRCGAGRRRGRQVRPDRRRGRDRAEHPDQPADSARDQARSPHVHGRLEAAVRLLHVREPVPAVRGAVPARRGNRHGRHQCRACATNRCTSLAEKGLLTTATTALRAEEALDKLLAYGWEPDSNVLQPSHYVFATTSITMTYSNAHGRFSVLDNLCGLSFAYTPAGRSCRRAGLARRRSSAPATACRRWAASTSSTTSASAARCSTPLSISPSTLRQDYNVDGALCQRDLLTANTPNASRVQLGIKQVQKSANLQGKPAIIVHGRNDTLVPTNFSSRPYYAQNKVVEGLGEQAALHRGHERAALRCLPAVRGLQRALRPAARVLQPGARRDVRAPHDGRTAAAVAGGQDDAARRGRATDRAGQRAADLGDARQQRDHVRRHDADHPGLIRGRSRSIDEARASGPLFSAPGGSRDAVDDKRTTPSNARARRRGRRRPSAPPLRRRLGPQRRRPLVHRAHDLLPELRRVLVAVHRHRVLDRGLDEFLVGVGRNRDRAVHLAGELAAVDVLASHAGLPWFRARALGRRSVGAHARWHGLERSDAAVWGASTSTAAGRAPGGRVAPSSSRVELRSRREDGDCSAAAAVGNPANGSTQYYGCLPGTVRRSVAAARPRASRTRPTSTRRPAATPPAAGTPPDG